MYCYWLYWWGMEDVSSHKQLRVFKFVTWRAEFLTTEGNDQLSLVKCLASSWISQCSPVFYSVPNKFLYSLSAGSKWRVENIKKYLLRQLLFLYITMRPWNFKINDHVYKNNISWKYWRSLSVKGNIFPSISSQLENRNFLCQKMFYLPKCSNEEYVG